MKTFLKLVFLYFIVGTFGSIQRAMSLARNARALSNAGAGGARGLTTGNAGVRDGAKQVIKADAKSLKKIFKFP